MVLEYGDLPPAANHPTPEPHPERHWDDLLDGFGEYSSRIGALDRHGLLRQTLRRFAGCEVRLVPRATQVYVEIERMLWHPASLADQPAAVARAEDILTRQAVNAPAAPTDPAAVAAEVADLLVGDIPVFTFTPETGRVVGPRGTVVAEYGDLLDAAVDTPVAEWTGTAGWSPTRGERHHPTGQAGFHTAWSLPASLIRMGSVHITTVETHRNGEAAPCALNGWTISC